MSLARTRLGALLVALIVAGAALAGCSDDSSDSAATTAPETTGAAFPVTIDTAYGEITVDEKPQRIVALSGRHIELLSLIDEQPVAFTDYGADNAELLDAYPWMEGTFTGEADPRLFTGEGLPSAEAVAAYEPDLILTTIWQTDEQLYEQLSQIAPTYVGTAVGTNTSWQDDLTALATLTGNDTAVVAETEAELAAALEASAERLPGLQGKTFQLAVLTDPETLTLTEYGVSPVMGLGLVPGDDQPTTVEEGGADSPTISRENVEKLTADVVLIPSRMPGNDTALKADPRVETLPASENGTLLFLTPQQWNAINGGSAVSEMWWLEQMTPVLEASALNGGEG